MVEFLTSTDGQEFRAMVGGFTAHLEPVYLPGPTRFSEAETRGFRHINPDGMFMLGISESRIYLKNRAARAAAKLLVGPSVLLCNVTLNDLENPSQNRSFVTGAMKDHVMVVQGGERPRMAEGDDIALLNQALTLAAGGRDL